MLPLARERVRNSYNSPCLRGLRSSVLSCRSPVPHGTDTKRTADTEAAYVELVACWCHRSHPGDVIFRISTGLLIGGWLKEVEGYLLCSLRDRWLEIKLPYLLIQPVVCGCWPFCLMPWRRSYLFSWFVHRSHKGCLQFQDCMRVDTVSDLSAWGKGTNGVSLFHWGISKAGM